MAHNIHCLNCGDCEAAHEDNDCLDWEPDPKEAEERFLDWLDASPEKLLEHKKEIEYLFTCCEKSEINDKAWKEISEKMKAEEGIEVKKYRSLDFLFCL